MKYRILEQPTHSIFSKGWDSEFIPQYYSEKGTWEYFYYVWETTTEWFFFTKTKGVNYHMYRTFKEAVDYLDLHTGKIEPEPTIKVHEYPITI